MAATTDEGAGPEAGWVDGDVAMERLWLDDGSWVDIARGWLRRPEEVFAEVRDTLSWSQVRVWRYERWMDEPRLGATFGAGQAMHPALAEAHRVLRHHYGVALSAPGLAQYRHERDSVAFHRDRELRWLDDTVIAIVSLGARRRFLLRPRANRYAHALDDEGATHDLSPAGGDLLVMGGRCQADWEHAVPKQRQPSAARISAQWRWTSRGGRPVQGASYRAPRTFSRRG